MCHIGEVAFVDASPHITAKLLKRLLQESPPWAYRSIGVQPFAETTNVVNMQLERF